MKISEEGRRKGVEICRGQLILEVQILWMPIRGYCYGQLIKACDYMQGLYEISYELQTLWNEIGARFGNLGDGFKIH